MSEEETGVCMFAYNNSQIDYVKIAHIAAAYVKQNMKNNSVTLITDNGTYDWLKESTNKAWHNQCFDNVLLQDVEHKTNPRKHYDSPWTEFNAQFSNSNKHDIFQLSPYNKTLLIDTDYFIQNNYYDFLFDSTTPLALHRDAIYMEGQRPYMNECDLNESGIHHWWSTVVYFDKSEESELFFDIWSHVRDNWDYYYLLYQFPPALFRTDFCVSIAAHLMNGFTNESFVEGLSMPLLNMDQKDDLIEVKDTNDLIMLSHNRREPWKNILVRLENTNIHVMNKRAISRHADLFIEKLQANFNV
jgi:hypothetical protein